MSLLSQLRGADSGNGDAQGKVENQWRVVAQDLTPVIQSKEALLQLVTEYCTQTQAAKTTMERLTAELDALEM